MKTLDQAKMLEATRLTRAGRLSEALSLLGHALGRGVATSPTAQRAAAAGAPTIEGEIVGEVAGASNGRSRTAPKPGSPTGLAHSWTSKLPHLRHAGAVQSTDIAPTAGHYSGAEFTSGLGSRAYKVYVPSRRGDGPRPLIVMLHGCTQSADDFAAGTRMNFAAEARGCFVVYPEQAPAANVSKCWNWFRSGDQVRDEGEPALIAGITRQIMTDHNIDPRRVFIAGLSAGGAAAAIMGEAYPDLYAAVGVHSGLACGSARDLPSALAAMRGQTSIGNEDASRAGRVMPTIVFHGDRDGTVHPSNGTRVIARAAGGTQFNGTAIRKDTGAGAGYSLSVEHDAHGRSVLELWELHGAGHAWSGGSPAGSFTNPDGPNATDEMLRFFLGRQGPGF